MKLPVDNDPRDARQEGGENRVHRFNGIEVPDNEDPWCAGYAAGLRASGSTHVDDDHVDPRVVVVGMLPDEYLEEAVAKDLLIELRERVLELGRRVARLVRDYPPRLH